MLNYAIEHRSNINVFRSTACNKISLDSCKCILDDLLCFCINVLRPVEFNRLSIKSEAQGFFYLFKKAEGFQCFVNALQTFMFFDNACECTHYLSVCKCENLTIIEFNGYKVCLFKRFKVIICKSELRILISKEEHFCKFGCIRSITKCQVEGVFCDYIVTVRCVINQVCNIFLDCYQYANQVSINSFCSLTYVTCFTVYFHNDVVNIYINLVKIIKYICRIL